MTKEEKAKIRENLTGYILGKDHEIGAGELCFVKILGTYGKHHIRAEISIINWDWYSTDAFSENSGPGSFGVHVDRVVDSVVKLLCKNTRLQFFFTYQEISSVNKILS